MGTLDTHNAVINWGDGNTGPLTLTADGTFSATHQYLDDDPTGTPQDEYAINVTVTDDDGGAGTANTAVTVSNVAPAVGAILTQVDPIAVTTVIAATANFTDPGMLDTHTAVWNWGDLSTSPGTIIETNGSGSVSGSHSYSNAGVYTINLTVTDDDSGAGMSFFQYIVVYDPSAGFVTGGGWIDSPAGAYSANLALTGKANFGFVSKYENGNNVPTGNTEFQFKVADFKFKSTSYEWLVVSGAKARFRGVGTVNGAGSYGFELTAWDGVVPGGGGVEQFRIKIWNQNQGNGVVYDNMMGAPDGADPSTSLGGGSIVIHKNSNALLAAGGPAASKAGGTVTQESLTQVVDQAITYWRNTGVDSESISNLRRVHVQWADLPDAVLGIASATDYIWIDRDAAGYGWRLESIGATNSSVASGMDLLSVVAHELGHKLGFAHSHDEHDVMAPMFAVDGRTLTAGGASRELLDTSWAIPVDVEIDFTRPSRPDTWPPTREFEDTRAHDLLFASLDTGPVKPGLRSTRIALESVSDTRKIPLSEQDDLLGEDLMEAMAMAHFTKHAQRQGSHHRSYQSA